MEEKDKIKINKILTEARNSISDFCINECKAKCCKKGKLILLNEKEVNFICSNKKDKYLKRRVLKSTKDGNFTFNHERVKCPYLTKDNKCSEWKNPNRPKVCYDFPLFFSQDKYIITAQICPSVVNGKLNEYLEKLKKFGLKII